MQPMPPRPSLSHSKLGIISFVIALVYTLSLLALNLK